MEAKFSINDSVQVNLDALCAWNNMRGVIADVVFGLGGPPVYKVYIKNAHVWFHETALQAVPDAATVVRKAQLLLDRINNDFDEAWRFRDYPDDARNDIRELANAVRELIYIAEV